MKINLKDVKQLEVDKACQSILHCNTVDKSHVSQYKDGKFKATVLLADETDVLTAYVYDMEVLELFSLGQPSGPGVQICNFIPKANYIVINKYTNVFASSPVQIPDEIQKLITKKTATEMDTSTVAVSPIKTTVSMRGIVAEISPVQKKRVRSTGEEISFKRALLRDDVGEIPICLWRDLAENNVQKGDCIKVTNFSVSETFGDNNTPIPAICNKFETSSVEIIPDTNDWKKLLTDDPMTPSQKMRDDPPQIPIHQITGVGKFNYYLSCKNAACYRKKLKDLKCEKCGLQHEENAAEKSLVGSIIINSDRKFTLFTQHAESLKSQLNISDDILSPNFHSCLITLLPIKAQIENIGDKVMRINVIHD